jgi:hypothetical protein
MPADLVAHADWGSDPPKRVVATARRAADRYRVVSLAAAPDGDLLTDLDERYRPFHAVIGFDFPIGLPRAYAAAVGARSFPDFLGQLGAPPWLDFDRVASQPAEISLGRPFYPARPGGTRRQHLYDGLGLSARQLRRRCDGSDAETLFWTLGGKQAGKAALHGWRMLRQSSADMALWPFAGPLDSLLAGPARFVVAETYPREFYRHAGVPRGRWSKRRAADRLRAAPGVLSWAGLLGVRWDAAIRARVAAGCSCGRAGEDEFDAVVGLLGMIGVLTGAIQAGPPAGDPAVVSTEGWILGRGCPSDAAAFVG